MYIYVYIYIHILTKLKIYITYIQHITYKPWSYITTTYNVTLCKPMSVFDKSSTPNLPTNIIPTKIARLKLSGKSPTDMRIQPLIFKIMLESNPLKSIMLVGRLGVLV